MAIASQIREFIKDTFFMEGYADGDSFLKNGIIDSTGMLELIGFAEQVFEIKVEDAELVPDNLDSVTNLVQFIERKRARALTG